MNKERVTGFLYQAVEPTTSDCSIFYRKRGLGPDQSHYNQSRRWFWLQTTLAQITRIDPKWIYAVSGFFEGALGTRFGSLELKIGCLES